MKSKIFKIFVTILLGLTVVSGLFACSTPSGGGGDGGDGGVETISSTLLDGKIANFLGAQGLGVLDKNDADTNVGSAQGLSTDFGASAFSAVTFEQTEGEKGFQKKNELMKSTEDGHKDVHFYDAGEGRNSYKDLNKQFNNHHHKGAECKNANCDQISDEIEQHEQEDESKTIISLDARMNKLYNYGDFTFFSVSSAVEGEATIRVIRHAQQPFMINVGDEMVVVNAGNGEEASSTGVSFIQLEDGIIFVKQIENDMNYHVSNYWSDDYNQSYVTYNKTGKTYSLSAFPRIFSVENGILKIYNETANGRFDYYQPVVGNDGEVTFEQIVLPSGSDFVIPFNSYVNVLKADIHGNKVIESGARVDNDNTYDQNGEKKVGDKIIGAVQLASTISQIQQQGGNYGQIFARRFERATRYHMGSDGRIYRLNFKGNLSEISVNVLNENCVWQSVENTAEVTFDIENSIILWSYSLNQTVRDYFRITKISGGYAYYSSAATTDGGRVWESHLTFDVRDIEMGEYSGVVKIPVDGPTPSTNGNVPYLHLESFYEMELNGVDFSERYRTFLIGETQMLTLFGRERGAGQIILTDVTTGETKELGDSAFMGMDEYNIKLEGYGWLSLIDEIDFANFDETNIFTAEPIDYDGGLDAYFKFLTEQIA